MKRTEPRPEDDGYVGVALPYRWPPVHAVGYAGWQVSGTDPDRPRYGGSWPQSITLHPDVTGWTTYNPNLISVHRSTRGLLQTTLPLVYTLLFEPRTSDSYLISLLPAAEAAIN